MIDGIDETPPSSIISQSSSRQFELADKKADDYADVLLQADFAALTAKAMTISQADKDVLERAQELLISQELESAENIRQTAKSLIDLGI